MLMWVEPRRYKQLALLRSKPSTSWGCALLKSGARRPAIPADPAFIGSAKARLTRFAYRVRQRNARRALSAPTTAPNVDFRSGLQDLVISHAQKNGANYRIPLGSDRTPRSM